jgi:hypothetical protein
MDEQPSPDCERGERVYFSALQGKQKLRNREKNRGRLLSVDFHDRMHDHIFSDPFSGSGYLLRRWIL